MKFRLAIAGLFAGAASLASASAATIEGAAVGISNPDQIITFSEVAGLTTGDSVTDEYAALGVTFDPNGFYFSSVSARPNVSGPVLTNFVGGNDPAYVNPLSIKFSNDVSAASFTLTSAIRNGTFEALLDGVVVSTFMTVLNPGNNVAADVNNIYGFFDILFDEIRVTIGAAGSNNAVVIDNLAYATAVPLPAALPLFLAGIAGIGFAGRGRRKA